MPDAKGCREKELLRTLEQSGVWELNPEGLENCAAWGLRENISARMVRGAKVTGSFCLGVESMLLAGEEAGGWGGLE